MRYFLNTEYRDGKCYTAQHYCLLNVLCSFNTMLPVHDIHVLGVASLSLVWLYMHARVITQFIM